MKIEHGLIARKFPVWMTIEISPKTGRKTLAELEQAGIGVSRFAREIILSDNYQTLKQKRSLNLARVKVSDLEFESEPTYREIWSRIEEIGGELCPPEAGPEIRKVHHVPEYKKSFFLAMRQIKDADGAPDIFCIGRSDLDGSQVLDAFARYPDKLCAGRSDFVLVLPDSEF